MDKIRSVLGSDLKVVINATNARVMTPEDRVSVADSRFGSMESRISNVEHPWVAILEKVHAKDISETDSNTGKPESNSMTVPKISKDFLTTQCIVTKTSMGPAPTAKEEAFLTMMARTKNTSW